MRKLTIIILGLLLSINLKSQDSCIQKNYEIKDIIKFNNKYLIKTIHSLYSNKGINSKYFEYNDSEVKIFKINNISDIISISENTNEYYCLLRNYGHLELFKSFKNDIKWVQIFKFKDDFNYFDLIVNGSKIMIISNHIVYHNYRKYNLFEQFDIRNLRNSERNFDENSVWSLSNNEIFIGNDYGEWGGELYKLTYNKEKSSFVSEFILFDNVKRICSFNDQVYVLCLISSTGYLLNNLYKTYGNSIDTIYSQEITSSLDLKYSFKSNKDKYKLLNTITNGCEIRDIKTYKDEIYFFVFGCGIYRWNNYILTKLFDQLSDIDILRIKFIQILDDNLFICYYNSKIRKVHLQIDGK